MRQSGDAWADHQHAAVMAFVFLDFARLVRARTDQAHVALQDVEELGELVNRETPQEPADAGHARIVLDLVDRTAFDAALLDQLLLKIERRALVAELFADRNVGAHRAELVDLELAA